MLPFKNFCLVAMFFVLALALNFVPSQQQQISEEKMKELQGIRERLGVYMFSSSDYPAMFAIIAGLSTILIVAVVFISVGLFTMEPAKDSIIYRMTAQRMKKD